MRALLPVERAAAAPLERLVRLAALPENLESNDDLGPPVIETVHVSERSASALGSGSQGRHCERSPAISAPPLSTDGISPIDPVDQPTRAPLPAAGLTGRHCVVRPAGFGGCRCWRRVLGSARDPGPRQGSESEGLRRRCVRSGSEKPEHNCPGSPSPASRALRSARGMSIDARSRVETGDEGHVTLVSSRAQWTWSARLRKTSPNQRPPSIGLALPETE